MIVACYETTQRAARLKKRSDGAYVIEERQVGLRHYRTREGQEYADLGEALAVFSENAALDFLALEPRSDTRIDRVPAIDL